MSAQDANVTPMMAQFLEIKAQNPDALLFYRMGDFYEMFFDDAVAAAAALDIALTKRGQHQGADIPMCGVPVHSAEGYLLTLIRKGFRVAIAEQLEDPAEARKRGSKSVVKRDVVRLVTPGTLTEESLLEARRHNFLAAFAMVRDEGALAWADISTGELRVMPCPRVRLTPELARLAPRELVVLAGSEPDFDDLAGEFGLAVSGLARASFDSTGAEKRLCALFGVSSLEGFGQFGRADLSALGALVEYLDLTQRGQMPLLRPPVRENAGAVMQIDAATRRSLELTQAMGGGRESTLLAAIDMSVTAAGARLLERRISSPSCDLAAIQDRLAAVSALAENDTLRADLRAALKQVPDMDRALSRLSLDRGGPRDLAMLRNGLAGAGRIAAILAEADVPPLLTEAAMALVGHEALTERLETALVADPPLLARDGGFIAAGVDDDLDEARRLRDEGRGVIAAMQADYIAETGINALKIKHNNVLGYFIETTATHADKMRSPPLSERFIHRQTTANQVRFTTVELSEMETRILNAGGRALEIEKRLFETLRAAVLDAAGPVHGAARALAEIDTGAGLAELARLRDWSRPQVDDSRSFAVTAGRHPVVEQALAQNGQSFVANDTDLSPQGDGAAIWLVTGPNMAGKSTFLRQNALIALLAQAGSFVPAQSAHIGMVSQLFSRVGASDDLARGRSTFMVEMVETAAILNQADDRAFVILDEIGRGTATYDGLSIAWAVLEHLHAANRCRALFATHYHEMTALADRLDGVRNATVAVREWEGDVIFLHEVRRGAADRSYGVQVARLAGLPAPVIERARDVLAMLERGAESQRGPKALIDDLPLFSAAPAQKPTPVRTSAVEERLKSVHPDALSPRDALALLYDLHALMAEGERESPGGR
ncbi:MAG: DNA mismatch repair protein MutS [Rhodobacteraceae bacterium HLUCCA12]|nr:MAG: DNA mismatch repair protein MutS [Rhodobacteraceae bacterium HLUCCA12]